jgi:hypothetical protein
MGMNCGPGESLVGGFIIDCTIYLNFFCLLGVLQYFGVSYFITSVTVLICQSYTAVCMSVCCIRCVCIYASSKYVFIRTVSIFPVSAPQNALEQTRKKEKDYYDSRQNWEIHPEDR